MKKKNLFFACLLFCTTDLRSQVEVKLDSLQWSDREFEKTPDSNTIKSITKGLNQLNSYFDYVNISIRECYDATSRASCYCDDMQFHGGIEDAIVKILNINRDRIKFIGNLPTSKICFNYDQDDSYIDFNKVFFKVMRDKFRMRKIYKVNELCEIWLVEKTKRTKLPVYNIEQDGQNTYTYVDTKTKENISIGGPLEQVAMSIATITHRTIENHIENDDKTYNFKIPSHAFESFESLAKYLMNTYGILLRKEERVAPVTIVEF